MKAQRRPRGSYAPGAFWYYNNWDYNALGAVYARATGEDVYAALKRIVAEPIGMEDYRGCDTAFSDIERRYFTQPGMSRF